jgi:hypothetical protein
MDSETYKNKLEEKEAAFRRALDNPNTETSLLTYIKKDIDWFRDTYSSVLKEEKKDKK